MEEGSHDFCRRRDMKALKHREFKISDRAMLKAKQAVIDEIYRTFFKSVNIVRKKIGCITIYSEENLGQVFVPDDISIETLVMEEY